MFIYTYLVGSVVNWYFVRDNVILLNVSMGILARNTEVEETDVTTVAEFYGKVILTSTVWLNTYFQVCPVQLKLLLRADLATRNILFGLNV